MDSTTAVDRYRTAEVARILGVSAGRIRRMVLSGHCAPTRHGRAFRFAFQDLVLLRTAQGLIRSGDVSPRRLHSALRQLKKQLADRRPLSGVRLYAHAGRIVVRDSDSIWHADTGQQVFDFAAAHAAATVARAAFSSAPAPTFRAEPVQSADDWFEHGVRIEQDDPNGARRAYERAMEIDPDMSDAYVNLGRLVHEGGDPHGAAKFYCEALKRTPSDPITHYNLAVAYEDLGRLKKARTHYERALSMNQNLADAHFNLSRILEGEGEMDAARHHRLAYRRLSSPP